MILLDGCRQDLYKGWQQNHPKMGFIWSSPAQRQTVRNMSSTRRHKRRRLFWQCQRETHLSVPQEEVYVRPIVKIDGQHSRGLVVSKIKPKGLIGRSLARQPIFEPRQLARSLERDHTRDRNHPSHRFPTSAGSVDPQ